MNDLRQAAQAVIDLENDDYPFDGGEWSSNAVNAYEALRQALAEPVEAVGEIVQNQTGQIRIVDKNGESFDLFKHIGVKLYTTPPSIDALIAEIDDIDRWFYDDGSGPYMCGNKDGGDYYFISDIDDVLDKYRGVK